MIKAKKTKQQISACDVFFEANSKLSFLLAVPGGVALYCVSK